MKTIFDELKYKVLSLSTELDIERVRNDELERKLNESLRKIDDFTNTGISVSRIEDDTWRAEEKVQTNQQQIIKQEESITELKNELQRQKKKYASLAAAVETVREKCLSVDNTETRIHDHQIVLNGIKENITAVEKSIIDQEKRINHNTHEMSDVMYAFKKEKQFVRNLANGLNNNTVVKELITFECGEIKGNIFAIKETIKKVGEDMEVFKEMNGRFSSLEKTTADMSAEMAQTKTEVHANKKALNERSSCCSDVSDSSPGIRTPSRSTTTPSPSSQRTHPSSLSPLTLEPGCFANLPLDEEQLAQSIKNGSRVVWGDQVVFFSVCHTCKQFQRILKHLFKFVLHALG